MLPTSAFYINDIEFQNILEMLSARSKGGRVVHFQEVRQFGRYSQNLVIYNTLLF